MQARRVKFLRCSALNLPPEMEVSYMDVSTVITLLNLIINIIRLALYISKNKKK